MSRVRAESVKETGEPDGWQPEAAFTRDLGKGGATQLVVSVPSAQIPAVHMAMLGVLEGPWKLLWRQLVDRRNPRPQGTPPRDFVAVDLNPSHVRKTIEACAPALYEDARAEIWVAGRMGDEVILDADGLILVRPDDPAFRDVLGRLGIPEFIQKTEGEHAKDPETGKVTGEGAKIETIVDRNYVKRWFHQDCDALEDAFIETLGLADLMAT